jgi:predicted ATPase
LRDRLREAWVGAGQIVLLSGEAGIGKSRIAAPLAAEVANEPHTRLRYQCSPYHRDSVLYPFVVQLGRAAHLGPDDDLGETQLDKLEAILAPSRVAEAAPLFASLLPIPTGDRYPPLPLSAEMALRGCSRARDGYRARLLPSSAATAGGVLARIASGDRPTGSAA